MAIKIRFFASTYRKTQKVMTLIELRNSYVIKWVELVLEEGKEQEEEQKKEEDYNWDSHNESNDSGIDDDHDLIDISNDNFLKIFHILLIWKNNYFVIHGDEEGEKGGGKR